MLHKSYNDSSITQKCKLKVIMFNENTQGKHIVNIADNVMKNQEAIAIDIERKVLTKIKAKRNFY